MSKETKNTKSNREEKIIASGRPSPIGIHYTVGNKMRQTVCENIMVPEGQFGQTVCLILFPPVYML